MPRSSLSPTIRRDPTRAGRLIDKYENAMRELFRAYLEAARDALSKEFDVKLNLTVDTIVMEQVIQVLKDTGVSYAPELLAIAIENVSDAYQQGVRYGSASLKKAGVKVSTSMFPADWRALDVIQSRNLTVLEGITQDINDAIVREVSQGLIQGESISDIAERLEKINGMTDERAYKIARYETMFALNQGTILRYYQTGVEKVEWICGGQDGHTCDDCLELDGKVFDIEHVPDCPLHNSCRCTLAPVIYKDRAAEYTLKQKAAPDMMNILKQKAGAPAWYLHAAGCGCGKCTA